jgi:flagellar motor switch protein FliM
MPTPPLSPLVRAGRTGPPDSTPYDFARPRAFSDRQLRAAADVHAGLADGLAAALGDALGASVTARCTSVDEVLAVDVDRSLGDPSVRFGLGDPPFALGFGTPLALFLVERQFGGTDPIPDEGRPLSGLERSVLAHDWLPLVAVAFAESWGGLPPRASAATPLGPPEAATVAVEIEVETGGRTARLAFAYPAPTLRALLETAERPAATSDAVSPGRVDDLHLDVRAEIGRVRLPAGDLLRLAVGDVIPLGRPPDAPLPVWIGDRLRFDARAGTRGSRLALQVLTPPEPPPDR